MINPVKFSKTDVFDLGAIAAIQEIKEIECVFVWLHNIQHPVKISGITMEQAMNAMSRYFELPAPPEPRNQKEK